MKFTNIPCRIETFSNEDDSNLLSVKLEVMHDGFNKNGSKFSLKNIKKMQEGLKKIPILGYIKLNEDDEYDFDSHNIVTTIVKTSKGYDVEQKYLEQPLGFIDSDTEITYEEKDGRTYLCCTGNVWKSYSNEGYQILMDSEEKSVSMEISVQDGSEDESDGYYDIKKWTFLGICILGEHVESGMFNTKLTKFSNLSKYKMAMEELYKEFSKRKEKEENMEKLYFGLSVENLTDQLRTQVNSRLVSTKTSWGETYEHQEFYFRTILPDENIAIIEDYEWNKRGNYGVSYSKVEDVLTIDFDSKKPYLCEWREVKGGETVESVLYNYESYENVLKAKLEPIANLETQVKEFETLKTNFSELETKLEGMSDYSEIKEKFNAMDDYDSLKEFKLNYDKALFEKEVEDATKLFDLDEEEISELKEKVFAKEITIEQFKEKLGYKFAMRQLENKSFSKEESKVSEVQVRDNVQKTKHDPYDGLLGKYLNK